MAPELQRADDAFKPAVALRLGAAPCLGLYAQTLGVTTGGAATRRHDEIRDGTYTWL